MKSGGATWLPIAAAAAVAVTILAVVLTLGGGENRGATPQVTADGTLVCPKTYQLSPHLGGVPNKPQGPDGSKHLVPDETPKHVVICAYLGTPAAVRQLERSPDRPDTRPVSLSGHKALGGDLGAITRALVTVPPVKAGAKGYCGSDYQPGDADDYLIGLTYPSGTEWVSAPGSHCYGATNGQVSTAANLRAAAAKAYATGRWPTS